MRHLIRTGLIVSGGAFLAVTAGLTPTGTSSKPENPLLSVHGVTKEVRCGLESLAEDGYTTIILTTNELSKDPAEAASQAYVLCNSAWNAAKLPDVEKGKVALVQTSNVGVGKNLGLDNQQLAGGVLIGKNGKLSKILVDEVPKYQDGHSGINVTQDLPSYCSQAIAGTDLHEVRFNLDGDTLRIRQTDLQPPKSLFQSTLPISINTLSTFAFDKNGNLEPLWTEKNLPLISGRVEDAGFAPNKADIPAAHCDESGKLLKTVG